MKQTSRKKGFTLVELLVVIAILAILATVSIVGYTSFIKKANESNDLVLTTQMNKVLAAEEVNGKPAYMQQAVEMLQDNGFDIDKLTPTTDGYEIVYDLDENRVTLLNESDKPITSGTNVATTKIVTGNSVWRIAHSDTEANAFGSTNSVYLAQDYSGTGSLEISYGFDAGAYSGKCTISVSNSTYDSAIVINASVGSSVTVNLPNGTVNNYGEAISQNVTAINTASYHLFGTIVYLQVNAGHIVVESGANYGGIRVKDGVTVDVVGNKYNAANNKVTLTSGTNDGYDHRITVVTTNSIAEDDTKNIADTTSDKLEDVVATAKVATALEIANTGKTDTETKVTANEVVADLAKNGDITAEQKETVSQNITGDYKVVVCNHQWGWYSDESGHLKQCTLCGNKQGESVSHDYNSNNQCDSCGYSAQLTYTEMKQNQWFNWAGCYYVSEIKPDSTATEIIIPSTYNGKSVKAINSQLKSTTLTKVTISEGIEYIEGGAFKNCTNLSEVDLPESLKYFFCRCPAVCFSFTPQFKQTPVLSVLSFKRNRKEETVLTEIPSSFAIQPYPRPSPCIPVFLFFVALSCLPPTNKMASSRFGSAEKRHKKARRTGFDRLTGCIQLLNYFPFCYEL